MTKKKLTAEERADRDARTVGWVMRLDLHPGPVVYRGKESAWRSAMRGCAAFVDRWEAVAHFREAKLQSSGCATQPRLVRILRRRPSAVHAAAVEVAELLAGIQDSGATLVVQCGWLVSDRGTKLGDALNRYRAAKGAG